MQWSQEWITSLIWIAKTFLVAGLGAALVVWALTRWTSWGRQVRRLAGGYFSLRRAWGPAATVTLIVLLSITSVRLSVLLSFWNRGLINSLQSVDPAAFWASIRLFGLLAGLYVVRVLVASYVSQAFEIRWRVWLNDHLVGDWLAGSAYYRRQFLDHPGDNPDQRIQVDVVSFISNSRSLFIGALQSVVSLVEYSVILWNLSAPITVAGVTVPHAMVFTVYLYVAIASVIAFRLGRPLIGLNFMSEKFSADFRYALIRMREYAENVAFYHGEAMEARGLAQRFAAVIQNRWAIVFRTLKFDGFNFVLDRVSEVFPYVVQAHRYFSGEIKLGDVMQTGGAFSQVQSSLSFFRESYDSFAQYRAVLDRLSGFVEANVNARALPRVPVEASADGTLAISELHVMRPDGATLMRGLALQLAPGDALLVQGPSGAGKTTLLRALAGLWPFAGGTVSRPVGSDALFLPQRPYLPLGSLRKALAYPADDEVDDTRLRDALVKVQLFPLADRVDEDAPWQQILSLGEQQRLAFARVLLMRPKIVFLDEATSATDEGLEHALYSLLRQELPDCILVSVGHRNTLAAFHTHRLSLLDPGRWQLATLDAR